MSKESSPPTRYIKKRSARCYQFFMEPNINCEQSTGTHIKLSYDIRNKVTINTLISLAEHTITVFKQLIGALEQNNQESIVNLFNTCLLCYEHLLSDLELFLNDGYVIPQTEYRAQINTNIKKAKKDYYLNWDKRIIEKAHHASTNDLVNTVSAIGAALLLAIPMIVNFCLSLTPIENAFKGQDTSELYKNKHGCLQSVARNNLDEDTYQVISSHQCLQA